MRLRTQRFASDAMGQCLSVRVLRFEQCETRYRRKPLLCGCRNRNLTRTRGTCEQYSKEGKGAINWTRLIENDNRSASR